MCDQCEHEQEQFAALWDSVERAMAMRDGARKILAEYDNPPEGGATVPRGWVEEHMAELRVAAEVERIMLGDLDNWKPEGLCNTPGMLVIDPGDA